MADGRAKFEAYARQVAKQNGIPPGLFVSLVTHESGWVPTARSPVGAYGLAQLMPQYHKGQNIQDPYTNLRLGAQELASYFKGTGGLDKQYAGSWKFALAAYNAGPGNVNKYGGIPPFAETQRYVPAVLGDAAKYGDHAAMIPPPPAAPTAPKSAFTSQPKIDFAPYVLSHLGKSGGLGSLLFYIQQQQMLGGTLVPSSAAVPASAVQPGARVLPGTRAQAPQFAQNPGPASSPISGIKNIGGIVYPVPKGIRPEWFRTDSGKDFRVPVGTPLLAMGPGEVVYAGDGGGYGPNWVIYKITGGPLAGKAVFIGHSKFAPGVHVGMRFQAGTPLAVAAGIGAGGAPLHVGPGWVEMGFAENRGEGWFTQAHYTGRDPSSHYSSAGENFWSLLKRLGGS